MSRLGSSLVALLAAIPLLSPAAAHAYDAENTHRWITRQAAEFLVATYPGEYDELLEYTDDVVEGSFHEDDLFLDGDDDPATLRVMRHFYNAPDGTGLVFGEDTFPSSFEWNGISNDQNEWDYYDGLLAYQKGDLAEAYFIAGHTVHMLSDLTVPAHSHLDDHGPPFGDTYENHCSARMLNEFEGSLRSPPIGTPIPEFASLEEAFQKTANASYYRNLYPGDLSGDEPTGVIADMFPDMSKGFFSGVWEIDGVGKEGVDFYEEQPGYYYFSKNEVASQADIFGYDPLSPLDREYAAIASDVPMVERMADELVPVAILHSASALKMFIDEARSLPKITDPDTVPPGDDGGGCNASSSSSAPWFALLMLLPFFLRRRQRD
jgi:MYXO-CTERM domain-containing protein